MAEVRANAGVPVLAQFTGSGAPTLCAPLVVDSATGIIYSLKTGDVVVAAGAAGTVTSVALSGGTTGLTTSGGPITTSGTITLAGTLAVANGGTGITAFGTGVATALGVNVGSAGAFVTFNGALGSPSTAGTIPAFTLGGTIAGGGNQLNNVIIGTTTPLAGFFTNVTVSGTGVPANGVYLPAANSPAISANSAQVWKSSAAGEINMPLQPAFLVTSNGATDVTGDNTVYTVVWDNEIFDQNGDFASNTFTAPVTGRYQLSFMVGVFGLLTTNNAYQATIVTSNRSYISQANITTSPTTDTSFLVSVLADMDAADTATTTVKIFGISKVSDIDGADHTVFSGFLAC